MPERSSDEENKVVTLLGPPGIYAQEAREQRKLLASEDLPIDTNEQPREWFEEIGVVFGEPVDDIFVKVTLPEGWSREGTSHSMWSYIVDAKGRRRIAVFYKGAFYDRKAHMRLDPRFNLNTESENPDPDVWDSPSRVVVVDSGRPVSDEVKATTVYATAFVAHDDYRAKEKLRDECYTWLKERYPLYLDPTAYWYE